MSEKKHRTLGLAASVGFMVAGMAGCASQDDGGRPVGKGPAADGAQVSDRRGDGEPDIISVTLTRSKSKGAVVRVTIAGVRPPGRFSDGLRLYVDPAGRDAERFIHESTVNNLPYPYESQIFDGWGPEDLSYQPGPARYVPGCNPSQRNLRAEPTVRVVELAFPRGCIDSSGARLSLRTVRTDTMRVSTSDTPSRGGADWWPKRRTMSRVLRF